MTKYVNNNYPELEKIATESIKGNKVDLPKEVESISVHSPDKEHVKNTNTIVEFLYKGNGTVSNTKYYGFYYSTDDLPAAYQNEDYDLLELGGNKWMWSGKGDNEGLTGKIRNHWYYYSATF